MTKEEIEKAHTEIEKTVKEAFENESDDSLAAARFLLWSAVLGPDENKIAEHMTIDPAMCSLYAETARKQGIWKDGHVVAGWFDEDGMVALLLDMCVLQGIMNRT